MQSNTNSRESRFLSRVIEVAANVATLVVAILLTVILVRNYFPTPSPRLSANAASVTPTQPTAVGTDLSKRLSGVGWNKEGSTLVLALSTHCHFCKESSAFFRRITASVGKDVKVVGLLPEPVSDAKSYLSDEGIHLDEIEQTSMDKVGVRVRHTDHVAGE